MSEILRPPYIKGKNFVPNPVVKYGIPKEADSRLNPRVIGTPQWEAYWNEQIFYCKNGFQTGGVFIPGRFYYYLNFNSMSTGRGIIAPDMVDLHLELAYLIDFAKANKKNIICAKKRRAGISEFTQKAVIDYGWRFTNGAYQGGVAAGQETFAHDFMRKWRDSESLLPPELRIKKLKDNDGEIVAGYKYKNESGELVDSGSKNTIFIRTMYKSPGLFKGLFLLDVIAEECGEFEKLEQFYQQSLPCIKDGNEQIGTFFMYGCVCAGTKVWDNKGNLINIEDLKQEDGILGYSGTGISKEKISWMKPPAQKPCYRITTSGSNVIECSEDHPLMWTHRLYTEKQIRNVTFKRAFEVKPGDQLVLIDKIDLFGNKTAWMPRFIGMMIGDGNITANNSPNIGSCDKSIQDYIESNFNFSITKTFLTKKGEEYKNYSIRNIIPNLKESGIYGLVKQNKRLPADINEYDKNSLAELLGGYYDTDGNVKYNAKYGYSIVLTSIVKELLTQVKFQLTKFGINSNLCKEMRHDDSGYGGSDHIYRLYISKIESVRRFRDSIPLMSEHKRKALFTSDWKDRKGKMSEDKYNFILNEENNKGEYYLGMDCLTGLRHETVKSVEFIGMKDVYNLTASVTHTYLANNFVTGNTGGNLNKGGKAFEAMWEEADHNNFIRFLIPATRFHKPFYGGYKKEGESASIIPNLLTEYKPYELIGVEDFKAAEEDILKERKEILRSKNTQKYQEHLRDYPLTKEDIFALSVNNDFDSEVLNDQRNAISTESAKYIKCQLDWVKDKDGEIKHPHEVVIRYDDNTSEDGTCILIHQDHLTPIKSYDSLYCAGIDSYDQNQARTSKSKGAMCVLVRPNDIHGQLQKAPVATICCRPPVKETFYEMCLKLAIFFDLKESVLIDIANKLIYETFEQYGHQHRLAYRPKKFEAENSQQTNVFGIHLNNYSKPLMVGLMQSAIIDYGNQIWFPDLIKQLANYNQVTIGSDNDLADAYGIALMQHINETVPARSNKDYSDKDVYQLKEWTTDAQGNKVPLAGGIQDIISLEADVPGRFLTL